MKKSPIQHPKLFAFILFSLFFVTPCINAQKLAILENRIEKYKVSYLIQVNANSTPEVVNIERFNGNIFYGTDNSVICVMDTENSEGVPIYRLRTYDKLNLRTVADVRLTNINTVLLQSNIGQILIVNSATSKIYLPELSVNFPDNIGKLLLYGINFRAGSVKTIEITNCSPSDILSQYRVPRGVCVNGNDLRISRWQPGLGIVDFDSENFTMVPINLPADKNRAINDIFYLPNVGLVANNGLALWNCLDTAYTTNKITTQIVNISETKGKIFPIEIKGKPALVWGEKTNPNNKAVGTFSSIVIYDWLDKKEIVRNTFQQPIYSFFPNKDASKIYYVDSEGRIGCWDLKRLSNTKVSNYKIQIPHDAVIIDAE